MPHRAGHNPLFNRLGDKPFEDLFQDKFKDRPPAQEDEDGITWETPYVTPDMPWIDKPETGGDTPTYDDNEFARYMYDIVMGGAEGTGYLTGEEWWAEFGEDFPTWEESSYYQQYLSISEKLGIVDEQERLRGETYGIDKEGLALKGLSKVAESVGAREKLQYGAESQFIATGGVVSGRNIRATEAVSEAISTALTLDMTGIDLDRSLLDIAYDDDLYDIEKQRITYEDDLFQKTLDYEKELNTFADDLDYTRVTCGGSGDCTEEGYTCVDGWCQPPAGPTTETTETYNYSHCECGGSRGECHQCDADGRPIFSDDRDDPFWKTTFEACTGWGPGRDEDCWDRIQDVPRDIQDSMGLGDKYDEFMEWKSDLQTTKKYDAAKEACNMTAPNFNAESCWGQLNDLPYAVLEDLGLNETYDKIQQDIESGIDYAKGKYNEAGEFIEGKWNEAGEFIEGAYDEAGNLLDEAGNVIWDAATDAWEDYTEVVEGGMNALCMGAAATPCGLYASGKVAESWFKDSYESHFDDCIKTACG